MWDLLSRVVVNTWISCVPCNYYFHIFVIGPLVTAVTSGRGKKGREGQVAKAMEGHKDMARDREWQYLVINSSPMMTSTTVIRCFYSPRCVALVCNLVRLYCMDHEKSCTVFLIFFNVEMINNPANHTNSYAYEHITKETHQTYAQPDRSLWEVTSVEIKRLIALLI